MTASLHGGRQQLRIRSRIAGGGACTRAPWATLLQFREARVNRGNIKECDAAAWHGSDKLLVAEDPHNISGRHEAARWLVRLRRCARMSRTWRQRCALPSWLQARLPVHIGACMQTSYRTFLCRAGAAVFEYQPL